MTSEVAIAALLDRTARRIEARPVCSAIEFESGERLDVLGQLDPTLAILAALGRSGYRGIRSGLRDLLQWLEGRHTANFELSGADSATVAVTVNYGRGARQFRLRRDPGLAAEPYTAAEFGRVAPCRITLRPPGRALAPLPAAAFRARAADILDCVRRNDREALLAQPPLIVVTGLTDRCNHRCTFCFRQVDPAYRMSPGGVFTDSNLTSLLLGLAEAGVLAVRLCGEGEDTIHPGYLKYLLLAHASGMNVLQITNGTMLARQAPVVARIVSFLRVSINGWNAEDYARKHGLSSGLAFRKVIEGVRGVVEERSRLASGGAVVCLSSVIAEEDQFDPREFAALMEATGADLAVLKQDRECSRAVDGRLVRLQIHGGVKAAPPLRAASARRAGVLTGDLLEELEAHCRRTVPRAFAGHDLSAPIEVPRDWVSELRLGCVLRYLRAEVERLEMYNCSLLHDFYGDTRGTGVTGAWHSTARATGIEKDLRRPQVLCPSCGWGDLFRLMNHFLDQEGGARVPSRAMDLERRHG